MPSKKILIIAAVILVVLCAGVFIFVKISNKPTQTVQNQNNQTNSTGSGNVNNTPVVTTTFKPHTDPAQPYATTFPRVDSPPQQQTQQTQASSTDSQTLQQQVAAGLIADSNGQYVQTVNSNGLSNADQNFYNDATTLNETQFDQKYVPDSNTDPLYNSASSDSQDNVVFGSSSTDNSTTSSSTTTSTPGALTGNTNSLGITTDPYVDSKIFTLTQTDTTTDEVNYITALNSDITNLNILQDTSIISTVISNQDQNQISSQITQVASIIQEIKQLPVPQSFLGLAESYPRCLPNIWKCA